jgi:DNA-binding transcriptional ArsR family regulator
MNNKSDRGYINRHQQIRDKLLDMAKESSCGCFHVSKIAAELGMDQRTVRAHLKILEIDRAGIFLDAEAKEFCTREGLMLLAEKIGLGEETVWGQES